MIQEFESLIWMILGFSLSDTLLAGNDELCAVVAQDACCLLSDQDRNSDFTSILTNAQYSLVNYCQ